MMKPVRNTSFRQIKSELPFRTVRATQSNQLGPIRFSRRLRNLSPEPWNFLIDTRRRLGKQSKHSIAQECSAATKIKRELSPSAEKTYQKRKQYVLDIINKGSAKDLQQLPSVGSKTAQRIVLFRNVKGSITKISDLANMPNFPRRRYENFLAQNCLKQTN